MRTAVITTAQPVNTTITMGTRSISIRAVCARMMTMSPPFHLTLIFQTTWSSAKKLSQDIPGVGTKNKPLQLRHPQSLLRHSPRLHYGSYQAHSLRHLSGCAYGPIGEYENTNRPPAIPTGDCAGTLPTLGKLDPARRYAIIKVQVGVRTPPGEAPGRAAHRRCSRGRRRDG